MSRARANAARGRVAAWAAIGPPGRGLYQSGASTLGLRRWPRRQRRRSCCGGRSQARRQLPALNRSFQHARARARRCNFGGSTPAGAALRTDQPAYSSTKTRSEDILRPARNIDFVSSLGLLEPRLRQGPRALVLSRAHSRRKPAGRAASPFRCSLQKKMSRYGLRSFVTVQ
jgi:hypothetical protein